MPIQMASLPRLGGSAVSPQARLVGHQPLASTPSNGVTLAALHQQLTRMELAMAHMQQMLATLLAQRSQEAV